jgi:hypothetical protein
MASDDAATILSNMAEDKSQTSAPPSQRTVQFEHSLERLGDGLWRHLKRRPYMSVALTGAAALTLASFVGVGELAFACLASYAVLKMVRQNEPPSQAFKETVELEKKLGL